VPNFFFTEKIPDFFCEKLLQEIFSDFYSQISSFIKISRIAHAFIPSQGNKFEGSERVLQSTQSLQGLRK